MTGDLNLTLEPGVTVNMYFHNSPLILSTSFLIWKIFALHPTHPVYEKRLVGGFIFQVLQISICNLGIPQYTIFCFAAKRNFADFFANSTISSFFVVREIRNFVIFPISRNSEMAK